MMAAADTSARKPNIVYILADDFGYGSANCYGADDSLVQTPAINRLAVEGVRFTNANTPSSVCSPTRYGVLMGRYPFRSRKKYGVVNTPDPLLPEAELQSLGEWLKQQGYATSVIGKWHLGFREMRLARTDWLLPLRPGPLTMGFDHYFGVPQNHGDTTNIYVEDDSIWGLRSDKISPFPNLIKGRPDYFGFDAPQRVHKTTMETLTDRAVAWLDRQEGSGDPFFLYFAPVAVHRPITPSDEASGTSKAGPYGDFIHDLDLSVGRLLEKLDEMGVADNTLVIFTSDNGGEIPEKRSSEEQQAIAAGLSINGSLRGDKHTIWEGGTRVPFVARLPGLAPPGGVSDKMINLVDSFATIAELVNSSAPIESESATDSVSFLAALRDPSGAVKPRESMITANNGGILAIRRGDWKYIEGRYEEGWKKKRPGDPQAKRQLYNLAEDPSETMNVLKQYPDVAAGMQSEIDALRGSTSS